VNSPQCYVICTLSLFYGISPLSGKRKLSVFENSMLGNVFGLKRENVSGGWIKLHDEGRDLYSSSILGGVSAWGEERRLRHVEHTEKTHAVV